MLSIHELEGLQNVRQAHLLNAKLRPVNRCWRFELMQLKREYEGEGDSHFKFRLRSTIVQSITAYQETQVVMVQTQTYGYHLLRSLLISGVLLASPLPVMAQRIPVADDTLGDERSIVSSDELIRNVPSNRLMAEQDNAEVHQLIFLATIQLKFYDV